MQQRVAIARAVACRSQVLLMDEPFAAVDAQTRADLEDLIRTLWRQYEITTLFVTHDIDEAVYLGQRILVLTGAPSVFQDEVAIDLPSERISSRRVPRRGSRSCAVRFTRRSGGRRMLTVRVEAAPKLGLTLAAVVLLAFNLRTAVTSLGAVLDDVRDALGLSATAAGVLTTLPVLCFAGFGAVAPRLARRYGTHRVIAVSVAAITLGLVVRAVTGSSALFFAVTAIALAGMATGNVLLPAIVKRHFPRRVGRMTGVYTTALMTGTTVAAAATVPSGDLVGGWRGGLIVWAVAAALALVPWLVIAMANAEVGSDVEAPRAVPGVRMSRNPLAWALAVYFGSQSIQAYAAFGWLPQIYRDAGFDAATSGLLLAVVTALGIPIAFVLPTLAARRPDQRPYVVVCIAAFAAFAAGYAGLLAVPATLPWLWVVLLGIGGGSFPLALTLIGLRAHGADVTARLSGFAQSIGYVGAAAGPVAVGALYDATGAWTAPIGLLMALLGPQLVAGWYAAGPGSIERNE